MLEVYRYDQAKQAYVLAFATDVSARRQVVDLGLLNEFRDGIAILAEGIALSRAFCLLGKTLLPQEFESYYFVGDEARTILMNWYW